MSNDTSTDRTLLERAAKAAGIDYDPGKSFPTKPEHTFFGLWLNIKSEPYEGQRRRWNPLEDDGDALRLAVARRFTVAVRPHEIEVFSEESGECLASIHTEGRDPLEATRYAITSAAAAEIGGE